MEESTVKALGIDGRRAQQDIPYTVTLDDDRIICRLIEDIVGLKTFGFSTATALIEQVSEFDPVGVFVDVNLAGNECGLDIIPFLVRTWPLAPVIVITGDERESLISQALSAGAHDFLIKPLRPVEVVARLAARRQDLASRIPTKTLAFGDITLDLQYKTLTGPKGQQHQSQREMAILTYLLRANGSVMDKLGIKRHVWGKIAVSDNALDRKLFEVRKSIRDVSHVVELKSVYGKGIVLRLRSHEYDQFVLQDRQLERYRSDEENLN